MYVNNITAIPSSSQLIMYAAATKKCVEMLANGYLKKISKCLQINRLHIKTSIIKYIIFKPVNKQCSSRTFIDITFKGISLEQRAEQIFFVRMVCRGPIMELACKQTKG